MTLEDYQNLEESQTIELKEAKGGLPKSLWETYSSFSNTCGGTICLGVAENKIKPNDISGVGNPAQLIKDLFATARNQGKVNKYFLREDDVKVVPTSLGNIIEIVVREAPRREKPIYLNGNLAMSYVRYGDGDHLATASEIKSMVVDNGETSYDLLPNPMGYGFDAVDPKTLSRYREELNKRYPANIYKDASDADFLRKIGCLIKIDNGKESLSGAALMMFASSPLIMTVYDKYILDYREADNPSEKWTNRIASDEPTWSGNMFDFYEKAIGRIGQFLPHPYRSVAGADIGGEDILDAVKEALANALSNYSPFLPGGLLIINSGKEILFRNTGRIRVGLEQAIKGGISDPRNEGVLVLFRRLGIADRAGTGFPRIFSTMATYHYPTPILREKAEPEETELILSLLAQKNTPLAKGVEPREIVSFLLEKGKEGATTKEVMERFAIGRTNASGILNDLLGQNAIETNGKQGRGKKYFAK